MSVPKRFTPRLAAAMAIKAGLLLLLLLPAPLPYFSAAVQAQSPALMLMAQDELQKRGLNESEVRARLLEKGINPESIPPAEYPKYEAQVKAVLDELQAEKRAAASTSAAATAPGAAAGQPIQINVDAGNEQAAQTVGTPAEVVSTESELPATTPAEAAAEAAQRVIQTEAARQQDQEASGRIRRIYGHSLFTDQSLEVFRTTDGAQAPDSYVLGPGDEIHISIFGASQTDIQQRIAPDGSIQPSGLSKIFLKGLTLAQAREQLRSKLGSFYKFEPDQIAVTIVTARTIMVNIFGETRVSGSFSLSALNSAFNALAAAGGPSEIGSVRRIELIRGKTRRTMDVYEFMQNPVQRFEFELQNNDILFVPVAQKLVSIEGAVKRPMSYEMLEGEDLLNLIQYAGGLNMDAYPDFVQIQRYEQGEEKLYEYNLSEVLGGKSKVALIDGDIVRLKSIGKPMELYVDIEGSVYYPGRYDIEANPSLDALLKTARPDYRAKTDFLLIERLRPDNTREVITVAFPGHQGAPDVDLQRRDRIRILDRATYRDVATIAVLGQVRQPFEREMLLSDRLTVNQALEMAGGLRPSVYPVAYIFRRNLLNPVETEYIRIELDKAGEMSLQPGDQLRIYDNTTYTNVGELRVAGAVKNPNSFSFDPSMSLQDLLINAGGFNVGAAFNRVEVFRLQLSPSEKVKLELITLEVDSSYQVVKPYGFSLQPYDLVVVRMTPEFTTGRVIELNGQVKYPGPYVLEDKKTTLRDVIKQAGGLLDDANPYGAQLIRTYNNRGFISINLKKAMNSGSRINHNPILFDGDVINIRRTENVVAILENGTRMAQYAPDPDNYQIKNVVYQGPKSAKWYVRKFAGGFDKNANRRSVTVTHANNQMVGTDCFLFVRDYPTVQPGSTITLQLDPEKIRKESEPKEKVDLESTVARSLATLTSTLSLILLVQQLAKAAP
jgi:protein involved in polysaccharide export with SLBB domain